MAFVIPKFMAVWTIPLLAEAADSGGAGAAMAATLLPLLNVSIPFSLYTSFDYLGFWLYSRVCASDDGSPLRSRLGIKACVPIAGTVWPGI
jgi:hypothetical protein